MYGFPMCCARLKKKKKEMSFVLFSFVKRDAAQSTSAESTQKGVNNCLTVILQPTNKGLSCQLNAFVFCSVFIYFSCLFHCMCFLLTDSSCMFVTLGGGGGGGGNVGVLLSVV